MDELSHQREVKPSNFLLVVSDHFICTLIFTVWPSNNDMFLNRHTDPIGKPICYVETTGHFFTLRCEAKHGTSCYFYMNNQSSHFKSHEFRNGGCLARASKEEMQKQSGNSITASVTCEVELLVEGVGSVKSVTKSDSIHILMNGED